MKKEKKIKYGIKIDEDMRDLLTILRHEYGISISKVICKAIENELKKGGEQDVAGKANG